MRDKYFASSNCSNSEFWSHIADVTDSDFILFTNCTSPLLKDKTFRNIIKIFKKNKKKFDSFNTTTNVKEYLIKNNKALNFKIGKTPNSQDLPDIKKFNFAINIISKKKMFKKKL